MKFYFEYYVINSQHKQVHCSLVITCSTIAEIWYYVGLFWTFSKGFSVSSTKQASAQHSIICDVSFRMDLTTSRFKLRLQCTHCICAIVDSILLCWEDIADNSSNIVCVLNFL